MRGLAGPDWDFGGLHMHRSFFLSVDSIARCFRGWILGHLYGAGVTR